MPAVQRRWDIFCRVIDNLGDAGVCWRLAADLAARGHQPVLWIDDLSPLALLAPQARAGAVHAGVTLHHWRPGLHWRDTPVGRAGQVLIEAFGCHLDDDLQAELGRRHARGEPVAQWINLEYLSAEAWVARSHGLPSPVLSGPASGLVKRFFFPGFEPATGGLLREPGLAERQRRFVADDWLQQHALQSPLQAQEQRISLFCYEPALLLPWLRQLDEAAQQQPLRLLVTPGRARAAVDQALAQLAAGGGRLTHLARSPVPPLPQPAFDELLWACHLNLVRGEDSLVRAVWAGRPWLWQAYVQDDGAHHAKLDALLDLTAGCAQRVGEESTAVDSQASMRAWALAQRVWNGHPGVPSPDARALMGWTGWQAAVDALRLGMAAQDDLVTRLTGFVNEPG